MSNVSDVKKIGRPATGVGAPITVRLSRDKLAWVDDWRADRVVKGIDKRERSRPEAIRFLVEKALGAGY